MNLLFLGATGVDPLGVVIADTLDLFVIFQLLDCSAQCRLGHEDGLGGPGETSMLGKGDDELQLAEGWELRHRY